MKDIELKKYRETYVITDETQKEMVTDITAPLFLAELYDSVRIKSYIITDLYNYVTHITPTQYDFFHNNIKICCERHRDIKRKEDIIHIYVYLSIPDEVEDEIYKLLDKFLK